MLNEINDKSVPQEHQKVPPLDLSRLNGGAAKPKYAFKLDISAVKQQQWIDEGSFDEQADEL